MSASASASVDFRYDPARDLALIAVRRPLAIEAETYAVPFAFVQLFAATVMAQRAQGALEALRREAVLSPTGALRAAPASMAPPMPPAEAPAGSEG